MCFPVLIVFTNMSSVQMPRPVFLSGVRLKAYEIPHGPEYAVLVALPAHIHGPAPNVAGVATGMVSGCPDNLRDMSGSGPFAPIFSGVWQSWHPAALTRYSPRLTRSSGDCAALCDP